MSQKNSQKRNKKAVDSTQLFSDEWRNHVVLALIIIYALAFLSRCINHQFLNWDDNDYILNNSLIKNFSLEGIRQIFTTPVMGMYNPIPFVIYNFQFHIWGLNPKYYHLVNIILHLLATAAIYRFMLMLTKRLETAAIVAILFAIHPMHVSVVAWVSETKTSIYLIFYFLALTSYLRYVQNEFKIKYLVFVFVFFVLSLLSKPSAVTFAPMLFLLDYYLRRKLDKRLLLEKAPFFALSLLFGIVTLLTHSSIKDDIFDVKNYSFLNSILVGNYAITFYFEKFFYPLNLSTVYPYPDNTAILPLKYYLSIAVIPIAAWLVYKAGNFRRELIFGLMFFLISISVMLRVIPSGQFGMSNVYSYLSYTGLFFIIGQFVVYVLDNKISFSENAKKYIVVFLCVFVIFCSWRTIHRVKVWENSITLFDDVVKKYPNMAMGYNQRASAKAELNKDYTGAIDDLNKAIELDPSSFNYINNRGLYKTELGLFDEALVDINAAIKLNPSNAMAYNNRGRIYLNYKNYIEAKKNFDSAIKFDTNYNAAYFNRGQLNLEIGDTLGAVKDWMVADQLGLPIAKRQLDAYAYMRK